MQSPRSLRFEGPALLVAKTRLAEAPDRSLRQIVPIRQGSANPLPLVSRQPAGSSWHGRGIHAGVPVSISIPGAPTIERAA
jgi:hypothetical protein